MVTPDAPTPQPPASPPAGPALPRWVIPTIVAVALGGLLVGFGTGWVSYQQYIAASMEQAAQEIEEDLGGGGGGTAAEGDPSEAEPAGPPEPTDQPTDGLFEYTILGAEASTNFTDQECGETYQAPDGLQYLVVDIRAENTGQSASMPAVDPGEARGYTKDGKAFETSMEFCLWVDEINPGTSTEYQVVFETPADTEFVALELAGYEAPEVAVLEMP